MQREEGSEANEGRSPPDRNTEKGRPGDAGEDSGDKEKHPHLLEDGVLQHAAVPVERLPRLLLRNDARPVASSHPPTYPSIQASQLLASVKKLCAAA